MDIYAQHATRILARMTSEELRGLLNELSDSELSAAVTIATTILTGRRRTRPPSPGQQEFLDSVRRRYEEIGWSLPEPPGCVSLCACHPSESHA